MTPDQERWAEALKVEQIHGDSAPAYVAERIGALALDGDLDGVERWQQQRQHRDGADTDLHRTRWGWLSMGRFGIEKPA